MELSKKEKFVCEMIWGGIPCDIHFIRNSQLFKDGLVTFDKGVWRSFYEDEIWKDIKGYEGIYQVSSHGRVKSLDRDILYQNGEIHRMKGKIRVGGKDTDGYKQMNLSNDTLCVTKKTHQLVFEAFVGDRAGKIINHIDGDKTNNAYWNLELVTNRENISHYYGLSGVKGCRGIDKRKNGKFRAKTTHKGQRITIGTFDTLEQASKAYTDFIFKLDGSNKYCI